MGAATAALAAPSPVPDWTRPGGRDFAQLGFSVAGAGDVDGDGYDDILVGAPFQDSNVGGNGAVYLYRGGPTGPAATAAWSYTGPGDTHEVGFAMAGAGDLNGDGFADVAIGAPGSGGPERVLIFMGGPGGLPASPDVTLQTYETQADFGRAVAGGGDVNGDGYDDLVVGAPSYPFYPNPSLPYLRESRGRVFIYLGGPSGVAYSPVAYLDPASGHGQFGYSVAGAGDVDGDGFDDILVGDPYFDPGSDPLENRGKVSLYRGTASGIETTAAWSALGAHPRALFGRSVAGGGDINGDGFPDVVIGSPWWDPAFNRDRDSQVFGRVDVFYGSPSGLGASPGWSALGGASGDGLGYWVSGGGDANGDGFADVASGASGLSNGEFDEGRAFIYYGGPSGPGTTPTWVAESNKPDGGFGFPIAFAGDTNGDSLDDVLLGCKNYNQGYQHEGHAFLYLGSPTSNLAPLAAIAPLAPQECSGPAGAVVLLHGSGSRDPNSSHGTNDDIVAFEWYEWYGTGAQVSLGAGEVLPATLSPGSHQITLDAIDAAGLHGTAMQTVVVVDTVPPVLLVTLDAPPLWPPNHRMVEVQARLTVADACGGATYDLVSVVSNEADDAPGNGDGHTTPDIAGAGDVAGDTTFLLRAERSGSGAGRLYTATYAATDASGNVSTATATLGVPLTRDGVAEPLILSTTQGPTGTLLSWSPVPEATLYDVVRGDLADLADVDDRIDLGAPVCLASGITQVSTAGFEDAGVPAVGRGYFYFVQYHGPEAVSFGTDSAAKPRLALSGGCP